MINKENQELARNLYIKSLLNRKQIAQQVKCTEKTLRKWIEKGDWDTIKNSETITRRKILQDSYQQLKEINNKIGEEFNVSLDKELSDSIGIIRKEVEAYSDMTFHRYIEVMTDFTQWLEKNHPQKVMMMVEILNEFINEIAKETGV